jgi:hypothetical protein
MRSLLALSLLSLSSVAGCGTAVAVPPTDANICVTFGDGGYTTDVGQPWAGLPRVDGCWEAYIPPPIRNDD